jgi:hypothetical protein
MRRLSFPLLLCALAVAASQAQVRFDTLAVLPVGPGMTHWRLGAPLVPWTVNLLEIDLRNPYLSVETAKANDRLAGYERTSSMAARRSTPGHTVIGAVNGDFYGGTGIPINIQVAQGEVLRGPGGTSAIGFTAADDPFIRIVSLSGSVREGTSVIPLAGVNQTRGTDQLVLYNRYMGASTGTNAFGAEALVRTVNGWMANDTVLLVVENVVSGVGNMAIPAGKGVLSGHGTAQTWINGILQAGDTVRLYQRVSPAPGRVKEMLGGFPKIVSGGIDYVDQGYVEEGGPSHTYERHPRTAIGFNADSSKLYFFTVDGRQTTSAGMTLHEVAAFLLGWRVHTAINLDGGGSTTMVVRGTVVNSPSDGGGERTVSNALLAVSSAPQDTLSRLLINPKNRRVYRGEQHRFTVAGVDRYGNPVALDQAQIRWSCPARIGTVDSAGLFTAAMRVDSGRVTVAYGALRDSASVVLKTVSRVTLAPADVVTDTVRPVMFRARAFDPDGIEKSIGAAEYRWSVSNGAVGAIDSTGVFRGRAEGETGVTAEYEGVRDTSLVRVVLASGRTVVDLVEGLQGWSLSGENVDTAGTTLTLQDGVATAGTKSLRVRYRFTYSPSVLNYVRLDTDLPVFGVPESLLVDFRPDSGGHRVFYYVDDDNGERFKYFSSRFLSAGPAFDSLRTLLSPAVPITPGAVFNFPIRLRRIEIQLGSSRVAGATYEGTILVDNIRAAYASRPTSVGEDALPGAFALEQNYPNPFNPTTVIAFSVGSGGVRTATRVKLVVYDVLGRAVAVLVDGLLQPGVHSVEWNARGMASGVYFCRMEAGVPTSEGGFTAVRKLVLVR